MSEREIAPVPVDVFDSRMNLTCSLINRTIELTTGVCTRHLLTIFAVLLVENFTRIASDVGN